MNLEFDTLILLIAIIFFIVTIAMRFIQGKKNGDSNLMPKLMSAIRDDFIKIVAKAAPVIMEADDKEGRDKAFILIIDMFNEFLDETDLLTIAEKDLVRLFDMKKLLYNMEGILIDEGVLREADGVKAIVD